MTLQEITVASGVALQLVLLGINLTSTWRSGKRLKKHWQRLGAASHKLSESATVFKRRSDDLMRREMLLEIKLRALGIALRLEEVNGPEDLPDGPYATPAPPPTRH